MESTGHYFQIQNELIVLRGERVNNVREGLSILIGTKTHTILCSLADPQCIYFGAVSELTCLYFMSITILLPVFRPFFPLY